VAGPAPGDGIVVGRVVKPHGIRGEVVVAPQSDVAGRFDAGTTLTLRGTAVTVVSSRPHAGRLLVAFEGVGDRNAAEELRGADVVAPAADVADSPVYFAHELVGMDVVTEDARWLGVVVDVVELPATAGYDLLEVDRDGRVWLLPSDDDLVEVGEDDTGTDVLVVVDPPAGLLPDDQDAAVEVPPHGEGA
jgi:16S rRNA processing protein RimM